MSDPFDPVSVHGVWPLVSDPASPGGIRFADLARDGAGDCVSTPEALPDAGLELRIFRDGGSRDAWCSAVAEFGGNAVSAQPLAEDGVSAALLIRFDRSRTPGSSVDACVALVGSPPRDAAHLRSRARMERAGAAREEAWRASWRTELDGMSRVEGLRIEDHNVGLAAAERLILSMRGDRLATAVWVEPSAAGRRVTLRMGHKDPFRFDEADLAAAMQATVAELGWTLDASGDPRRDVAVCDEACLRATLADDVAMMRTRQSLREESHRRAKARNAALGKQGAILGRLLAGFPLAGAPATSRYAFQVNPVSGHGVEVDRDALSALWSVGAIRPYWWSARLPEAGERDPFGSFESAVWVATPFGSELAGGRLAPEDAAGRIAAARAEAAAALSSDAAPHPLEGLATMRPAARWDVPAIAPEPRSAASGKAVRPPKRAKDLAQLAAWIVQDPVRVGAVRAA